MSATLFVVRSHSLYTPSSLTAAVTCTMVFWGKGLRELPQSILLVSKCHGKIELRGSGRRKAAGDRQRKADQRPIVLIQENLYHNLVPLLLSVHLAYLLYLSEKFWCPSITSTSEKIHHKIHDTLQPPCMVSGS